MGWARSGWAGTVGDEIGEGSGRESGESKAGLGRSVVRAEEDAGVTLPQLVSPEGATPASDEPDSPSPGHLASESPVSSLPVSESAPVPKSFSMRPIRSFDRQSPMHGFLLSVPIVICLGIWRRYAGKKGSSKKNGEGLAEHPPTTPASEADPEGFTPVNRKDCARQPVKNSNQPTLQEASRFNILEIEYKFIHTRVTQLLSHKNFCATFVYGFNHAQQRKPLWEDLETISHQMQEAWCILGDFNTILWKEDKMGGDEVEDYELQELQSCLDSYELTEMPYSGANYTWSNKTVWSRIDRALINGYWHDPFDYTHAKLQNPGMHFNTVTCGLIILHIKG
ncbi:LOW QUALITY PROTEIN: hypothetical protein Cgig2_019539 [Carnegiea gigantea]|uniref:Uncharacterized protein n=1 Tax=Carnegiea gigantea TaxID=171969 RepID=A0A9Q1QIP1_9CARY|nr:LOW QUALITY PROTEIN: hypothetical protein Cgig2_019539 [Carnegiea gigantea]